MKNSFIMNISLKELRNFFYSKNFLFFSSILLLISSYSYINSLIPIYTITLFAIVINLTDIKIKKKNLIGFLFFICFILCFLIISDDFIYSLRILRYYFGFIIFYIYFNLIYLHNINYKKLILFLLYWIVAESILINTILDPAFIQPDFRDTKYLGFYYRPWSFNTNPTATSGIIIFFYYFIENSLKINMGLKNIFLLCLAVLLLFSTTGFLLLLVFLFFKFIINKKNKLFNILFFILFILSLFYLSSMYPANYYSVNEKYINLEKISMKYIYFIYDYKKDTLINFYSLFSNYSIINKFFGTSITTIDTLCNNVFISSQDLCFQLDETGIGGDFSLIGIVQQIGLGGILSFLILVVFLKNNNLKLLKLYFIIFISFFHYSVIFMPLGQVFLALILSNNFNEKKI